VSEQATRPRRLVAFDLETTGLSPRTDRILEVGAVALDAGLQRIGEIELLVDPGMPIPLAIQRLTGITADDVSGAPSPAEAVAQLADFCEGAALVAHGGNFDMAFLASLLPEAFSQRLMFDTLELARVMLPASPSHSLPLLSGLLGLDHARPHRALSDASATGDLLVRLVELAGALDRATRAEMQRVAAQARGPLHAFFGELLEAVVAPPLPQGSRLAAAPAEDRQRPGAAEREAAAAAIGAMAGLPLSDVAAHLLDAAGPFARTPAYEHREAQVQMARAVGQTLERRRRLLVEAGTGVGKSLGYLTPLLLWAARTKRRAVVATHTVNLQEQLADRDLPFVNELLPTPLQVAVLKGRSHYISLRRWHRFLAVPDTNGREVDLDAIRFKLKVLAWLTQTRSGDRSELHLSAGEEQYWRRIESSTDDCLGRACANWRTQRCYMVSARRGAADAAIVVTNHALLLADSERQGQVLEAYDALVVDEAHNLEAEATRQLGTSLRNVDLTMVLDRLPALPGGETAQAIEQCREAGRRLFGDVKGFVGERLGGGNPGNGTVALGEDVRAAADFVAVLRAGRHTAGTLTRAAAVLEGASGTATVQAELLPQPERADDELALAAIALRELAGAIERIVCDPRENHVTWLEMRAEQAELHEAPVSVSGPLREHVFDRTDATVLTSATLSVGGSFDFLRHRVGIGDSAEELALASPFDYLSQALCVLPAGVPDYDQPDHEGVIASLVDGIATRLDGHTLVLFTGYGPLKRVHALLSDRLAHSGLAVLGQGLDGTRRQILRSFLDDPRGVLLGTNSFWEGVDIPGERLRCVVIDKLPFPVPSDPLVRARTDLLVDPFGQYILPIAVIRLRQGFGRLIRGREDRGAVVLCDERLATRDYGARFLQALPPAAVARVPAEEAGAVVEAFVKRGAVPDSVGQSFSWSPPELEAP